LEYSPDGIKMVFKYGFNPIGTKFYNCNDVKRFKELQYFKIQYLNNDIFRNMSNLEEVWIPSTVKGCGGRIFLGCENLKNIIMLGDTPIGDNLLFNKDTAFRIPAKLCIYVPDKALNTYKKTWMNYKYVDRVHPMSEYHS